MPHNFARDRYAPCRTGSGSLNRAPPGIRSIARLARSVPVPRHTWPGQRSQTFSSGHQLPFTENCWYLPRPLVPAAARSAWALEHKPATADKPESTALRCHKASYGKAPDPVFLAADGVTWRAVWEPQAKAPAGKANGAGRVAAVGDQSLEQLPE